MRKRTNKKKPLAWLFGVSKVDRLSAFIGLTVYFVIILFIGFYEAMF